MADTLSTTEHAIDRPLDQALDHDVIIIGAGVCGIYQLYRLLQMDLDVTVLEAGEDAGGTWYWNRYPGARFDSESWTYGYSFSDELLQEWNWSEHFAAQPETLRYLQHVVEKFDLRPHMQFDSTVDRVQWNEDDRSWTVGVAATDDATARTLTCRFLLTAVGLLSAPLLPRIEGVDDFGGEAFHTYHWPKEPIDLAGKRVGIIGTGATAVQAIPMVAEQAGSLTVFQRRPNWCAPLNNSPIGDEEMADIKARYDEIFERCAETPGGFIHGPVDDRFFETERDQRLALWEELYDSPGFGIWLGNYREVLMDETANAEFSEFMADKIRQRVDDPETAEQLIPTDHGFGIQRVPMETNYYEAYNRDNVHLVDIGANPIERITTDGVRLATGDGPEDHPLDVLIYATGFDAITGAFDRMDVVGVDDRKLRETWDHDPISYLGIGVSGFPNLITLAGPTSGSVSTNFPRGIELGVDWATDLLQYVIDRGITRLEVIPEAQDRWMEHVREMYGMLLLRKARSWFTGYNANLTREPEPRHMIYAGGNPRYAKKLGEEAEAGYPGFRFDPEPVER